MNSMQKSAVVVMAIAVTTLWLTQGTSTTRLANAESLDVGPVQRPAFLRVADIDDDDAPMPQLLMPLGTYDLPPAPGDEASLATLPPLSPDAVDVIVDGQRYWYDSGSWYLEADSGWRAARPPVGVVVSMLPPTYATKWIDGTPYYYLNGVYYLPASNGYRVSDPAQSTH